MNSIGLREIINEERQAIRSTHERLKRLDERLERLSDINTKPRITTEDLMVIIRDIFGTQSLEKEKYEIFLRWITENV